MHIKASPEEVYRALTNSFAIELWSGEPAQMEAVAGSEFSLWNGDIVGKNIEFVENEMIVQQW
ncbi:MAG: ATPase, partial [Bacteroidales bacterium]|nr:ATPase [Bacteroidales bacterium]